MYFGNNSDMKRICGMKKSLKRHMDERLLGWFSQVICMADDLLIKKIYSSTFEGTGKR